MWKTRCLTLCLALVVVGCGIEATPVALEISYDEPTTNADGTALLDLDLTSVYCSVGGPPSLRLTNPATAPTGGGNQADTITVDVPPGAETLVDCYATATDTNGNESLESGHIQVGFDFLPPAPPSNVK